MKKSTGVLAFLLVLVLGLAPRLVMIAVFPTIPVSDFKNLIDFAIQLRNHGVVNHQGPHFWELFNFGLPLALSGLLHLFPKTDPGGLARLATALLNGLMPLLPFFFWRGVLSLRARILAGALLALWPGQVLFSGVVAQDNWSIFPTIALGVLAVRGVADGERTCSITAALFYAAAAAFRADMLLILPLLLAAIRIDLLFVRRRQVIAGCLAAVFGLLGVASYRYACSGRFALSPQIGGLAILGSYIYGSSYSGWVAPYAYLTSVKPELLQDRQKLLTETSSLGVQEALRRPGFHALRILSMAGVYAINGEADDPLYESIGAPQDLPPGLQERGAALAARLRFPLRIEMALIQALFFAAALMGIRQRNWAILALVGAVLMKYFFHIFGVFQGRYFIVATALEILTIAVAAEEVLRTAFPGREPREAERRSLAIRPLVMRPMVMRALAAGAVFALVLWTIPPRMLAAVQQRDMDLAQHSYRFSLQVPGKDAEFTCRVDQGTLIEYEVLADATIRTLQPQNPAPGDRAVAECELTAEAQPAEGQPKKDLVLQVFDPLETGGVGGRMVQRVEVDGEEVYRNDLGQEPWSGWASIPLRYPEKGSRRKVVIEVLALHPEADGNWAWNARTQFRLARPSSAVHLAMGRPTAQSSTLPNSAAGSESAVDGNTNGGFYQGSVAVTNREPNPWWQVDLGSTRAIGSIVVWNRTDCCASRLSDYWVFVSDTPFAPGETLAVLEKRAGTWKSHQTAAPDPSTTLATGGIRGRFVRVELSGTDYLSLAEVQVFGSESALVSGQRISRDAAFVSGHGFSRAASGTPTTSPPQ